MAKANLNKFKGLIPVIDRRRVPEPYCVDGRNFFVDADGPVSGFAKTELVHEAITNPENVQSFLIESGSRQILFSQGVVLEFEQDARHLFPIFTFVEPANDFPWTHATVGGYEYFARKGVGLLEYNIDTGQWRLIDSSVNPDVPDEIQACCESAGRLVVAAMGWSAWTAIDDGTDFTPSTATGAGAQSLALVAATGIDDIITVIAVADGYLTITRNGIMRSQALERINPFQHRRMTTVNDPLPINPFCVIEIAKNQHVMLAVQGFFQLSSQGVQPYEQLMGEYFHSRILPFFDLDNLPTIVRLSVDNKRSWFIVSLATTQASSQYSQAFIYYLPSGEWGVYTDSHVAFVNFATTDIIDIGYASGIIDLSGSIFRFTSGTVNNNWPIPRRETYDYEENFEYPARYELTDLMMPSRLHFSHIDEGQFLNGSGVYDLEYELETATAPDDLDAPAEFAAVDAGAYLEMKTVMQMGDAVADIVTLAEPYAEAGLDAFIEIGLIRFQKEDKDPDEMSMITNVHIGMQDVEASVASFEDWLSDYSTDVFFDWETDTTGDEDWGDGLATTGASSYQAAIVGSNDGYQVYGESFNDGDVVMEEDLTLIRAENREKFFSCNNNGIFHIVRIDAIDPGEAFHLKTLELRGFYSGRAV